MPNSYVVNPSTDPNWAWDAPLLDYSIYPGETRSFGFTQRGCRLKCPFCVVPKKEGAPTQASELWMIQRFGMPRKIMLLDNDFFGGPNWRGIVEEAVRGEANAPIHESLAI